MSANFDKWNALTAERARLLNERSTKYAQASSLAARADNLAPADVVTLEALVAEIKGIDQRLQVIEQELQINPEGRSHLPPAPVVPGRQTQRATQMPAFAGGSTRGQTDGEGQPVASWIRWGTDRELEGDRDIALRSGALNQKAMKIRAGMSTGSSPGSNIVPKSFSNEFAEKLVHFCPFLEVANVIDTESGEELRIPVDQDSTGTYKEGAWISQLTSDTEKAPDLTELAFAAYTITSGMVPVSWELMKDSAVNVDQLLARILARRVGRGLAKACTTGDGSGQPTGCAYGVGTTGIPSGNVFTAASASALALDDLLGAINLLDEAYQAGSNCQWMMTKGTLTALRRLKDSQSKYLVIDPVEGGNPKLFGIPVVINNYMSAIGTGNTSIILADWTTYSIRRVLDANLVKSEHFMFDKRATVFAAIGRFDAKWENPHGAVAIKHP